MLQFLVGLAVVLLLTAIAISLVNIMNKQDILNKLDNLDAKLDVLIAKGGGSEDLTVIGDRITAMETKVDNAINPA